MASVGMPATGLFLVGAILVEVGAGILLLLGYPFVVWASIPLIGRALEPLLPAAEEPTGA